MEGKLRVVHGTDRHCKSWLNVFMYLPLGEGLVEGYGRITGCRRVDVWHYFDEAWMESFVGAASTREVG